jgi:hypothetical protein
LASHRHSSNNLSHPHTSWNLIPLGHHSSH